MAQEVCKFRYQEAEPLVCASGTPEWVEAMSHSSRMRGLCGESGGGGPGQVRERLTRASVVFAVISFACVGCIGPGLEPPNNDDGMAIGGIGGTSGAGGTGGASGVGGFDNAGTGGTNPLGGTGGGVGGEAGMAAGGVGGNGGAAGSAAGMGGTGGTGGAIGGTGGGGGAGGEAGTGATSDAGMDPEAPVLECEQGRDTVMLLPDAFAAPTPMCAAPVPFEALPITEMAVAITVTEPGSAPTTMWPARKQQGGPCEGDDAFYVFNVLDTAQVILCPALCDALVELGIESFKVELIYGCDPPE
jgi:hypothetical protein